MDTSAPTPARAAPACTAGIEPGFTIAAAGHRTWQHRSIRAAGALLALLVAGSGAFDISFETDASLLFGAAIPICSSLPSFAVAALLLAPMGGTDLSHLKLLRGAYILLVVYLSARLIEVLASVPGGGLPLVAMSLAIVAANTAILCHYVRRQEPCSRPGPRHD